MNRSLRWIAFGLLFAGTFQPHYWKMFAIDRAVTRRWMTALPYSKMPGLRSFMLTVRDATRDGDAIAVWLPHDDWPAYAYGYCRSTYLLAGRQVVPLVIRGPQPENLRFARYVACWGGAPSIRGFTPVLRHEHGVLLERVH